MAKQDYMDDEHTPDRLIPDGVMLITQTIGAVNIGAGHGTHPEIAALEEITAHHKRVCEESGTATSAAVYEAHYGPIHIAVCLGDDAREVQERTRGL